MSVRWLKEDEGGRGSPGTLVQVSACECVSHYPGPPRPTLSPRWSHLMHYVLLPKYQESALARTPQDTWTSR